MKIVSLNTKDFQVATKKNNFFDFEHYISNILDQKIIGTKIAFNFYHFQVQLVMFLQQLVTFCILDHCQAMQMIA